MLLGNKKKNSLTILVIAIVFSSYLAIRSIEKSYREQQIFCRDGLTHDMSAEDAIDYLQSFGDVNYNIFWDNGTRYDGRETVYVSYKNNKPTSKTYVLTFTEGKYQKVSAEVMFWNFQLQEFGTRVPICQE